MPEHEVTERLAAFRRGDHGAIREVFEVVYQELRRLARRQLHARALPATLSATELVHEAYLKLVDRTRADWKDRSHFYGVASRAMRQILVDHARSRLADKRGAGAPHQSLSGIQLGVEQSAVDVVSLDEALGRLEAISERLARVVELRFFGGLSVEETAEALEVTTRTVKRDWRKARALLFHALHASPETDAP
jgi:RNA polymerase sigma factor (TIGR02999 family)